MERDNRDLDRQYRGVQRRDRRREDRDREERTNRDLDRQYRGVQRRDRRREDREKKGRPDEV